MNVDETTELDWNWKTWVHGNGRNSTAVHYANLTRGVKCAPYDARLCRIQSTQCEAKVWDQVLMSAPDEMIARAALGQFIIVHDYSEKPRQTRAMWQGLTLIRMFMEFRWFGELRARYHIAKQGASATQYLRNVASQQDKTVKNRYDYFRDITHVNNTTYVRLVSCWEANGSKNCEKTRPAPIAITFDRPPSSVW